MFISNVESVVFLFLAIIIIILIYKREIIKAILINIHKITVKNVFIISSLCLGGTFIFLIFRYNIPDLFNINLGLEVDYLSVYACILGLALPLAILLMEKISLSKDYIIVETYLRATMLFPGILYFCNVFLIMIFLQDQYYFILSGFVSMFLIVFMYFRSFKLFSNLRYEVKETNKTRRLIVNDDLLEQLKNFSNENIIDQYQKTGIIVDNKIIFDIKGYSIKNIFPQRNLNIINDYNYKVINKIAKELQEINHDNLENVFKLDSPNEIQKYNDSNLSKCNIIIKLLEIGSLLEARKSYITIYYKEEYENKVKDIEGLLSEKIYKTTEENNHFYIKCNYEYLQKECVECISKQSSTMLSNSFSQYLDIYKDYVDGIKQNVEGFTFETVNNISNAFYFPRALELLKLIERDIIDYSNVILYHDNCHLMNELISFLYKMTLYSYRIGELISLQYLNSIYIYLNRKSLKLSHKSSYEKIKLELFELLRIVEYDLAKDNIEFNKDVLLVLNKTIGDILFELSKDQDELFYSYLDKIFSFINGLYDDWISIKYAKDEKIKKIYSEILINYNCNYFAILTYVVKQWRKKNKNITKIMLKYKDYCIKDITKILLETIDKNGNDRNYSWDLLEDHDSEEGIWGVRTYQDLIEFYCLIIGDGRMKKYTEIEITIPNNVLDTIIEIVEKKNDEILLNQFKEIRKINIEKEKEYVRKTKIDNKKVENFKQKFIKLYYEKSMLYHFLEHETFSIDENCTKDTFLGVSNIVDKRWFLTEIPGENKVEYLGMENCYAESFADSEEKSYAKLIEEKSDLIKEGMDNYFINNKMQYSNYVIFANRKQIYTKLNNNLVYSIPKEAKFNGIKSNTYYRFDNNYIPVFSIIGLSNDYIYLYSKDKIGKLNVGLHDFEIIINDFVGNDDLLNEYVQKDISGIDLDGDEKRDHLLESAIITIKKRNQLRSENMKGVKFLS